MKKDIRFEIRIKNNLLLKEIETQYKSVARFCREKNLHATVVCSYVNFQTSPLTRRRYVNNEIKAINGKYWKRSALKIAAALDKPIAQLFVSSILEKRENKFVLEAESSSFIPYSENLMIEYNKTPDLTGVLATLTPREEAILRMRYGFDGYEKTMREVAQYFGLSKNRISQIEKRALRKLRHPTRAKFINEQYA